MINTSSRRIHRLFLPDVSSSGQIIDLSDEMMHYTSRVLRLLDGTEVRAWNGRGQIFEGRLLYRTKKLAQIELGSELKNLPAKELRREIHILQGLPEGDKLDWVLEKCTEMGATGFLPVQAARSVVKLNPERAEKKRKHWQKVLESAANQCEREILPELQATTGLREAINTWRAGKEECVVLLFTPQANSTLKHWVDRQQKGNGPPVLICIGPEGGWTEDEIALCQELGAVKLNFSPRILRTETFGLACLSQLVSGLDLEP